jgi:hypothetical protein
MNICLDQTTNIKKRNVKYKDLLQILASLLAVWAVASQSINSKGLFLIVYVMITIDMAKTPNTV